MQIEYNTSEYLHNVYVEAIKNKKKRLVMCAEINNIQKPQVI